MLRVSTCFSHCSSCAKHGDFAPPRVMWTYNGDMNSTSGEPQQKTWKESSALTEYHLIVIVMEKILMLQNLLTTMENKCDIKYI